MMFNGMWMKVVGALALLMLAAAGMVLAEEPWTEATMVQASSISLGEWRGVIGNAVIDEKGGYAYFANWDALVKVALGGRNDVPRIAATMTIGERLGGGIVIDPENGYAYIGSAFATPETAGRIFKVALGEGDAPSTVTAVLRLDPELQLGMYSQLQTAVIDSAAGYAYFGYIPHPSGPVGPSQVVKVALGEGAAPPEMVGSVAMPEGYFMAALIDPVNGYAYFMITTDPGSSATSSVVKMALGEGSAEPTIVGNLHLRDIEALSDPVSIGRGAAIDVERGYAYFPVYQRGTHTGTLLKVAIGEGDSAPVYHSGGSLGNPVGWVTVSMLHPASGDVYLTTSSNLMKTSMHTSQPLVTEVLNLGDWMTAVISPSRDAIYVALSSSGTLRKINLAADADETLWLSSEWHFAEGATHPTFQTYYLLANPHDEPLQVEAEYLPEKGLPILNTVTVPANGRHTILANNILPNQGLSASFRAPSGKGFAAERTMYSMGPSNRWYGAHAAVGVTEPKRTWRFAEGSAGPAGPGGDPFRNYILLANPYDSTASIYLTVFSPKSPRQTTVFHISPKSRVTIEPEKVFPILHGRPFSTVVYTPVDGIIVERAMWWRATNWPTGSFFMEGNASPGQTQAGNNWYIAEGDTGGFDDFILLANLGKANSVHIRYYLEDGTPIDRTLPLEPGERRTINVRWDPEGIEQEARYGAMITSTEPIAVERSMYFSRGEYGWVGGHSSLASPGLSRKWLLPEGATVPGPVGNVRTEIQILNPQNVPAEVEVRFLLDQGATYSEHITIPAQRRYTILANDIPELAAKAFSTVVLSSEPIVVDRTMYFDGDTPALLSPIGSTASAGIPASAISLLPKGYTAPAVAQSATSPDAWTLYSPTATVTPTVTPTPVVE